MKNLPENDLVLISQVINNKNHQAFACLVEKYQSGIRHFLRRLNAGDYHAAEDLSQETFIIAFEKIHQYQSKGSFNSWLHTIAYRLFIKNICKANFQSYQIELHEQISENKALDADVYAEQLMKLLNPKQRVVITLSCAIGMSHEEIQKITQIPLGSVKSLIKRAKDKILQAVNVEKRKQNRVGL
ncbi:MAG: RNA polymerase sigma factor [Marinicellaceae bacterium]